MALQGLVDDRVASSLKQVLELPEARLICSTIDSKWAGSQELLSALHPLECPVRGELLHEPILLPSGVTVSKMALNNTPNSLKQWVGPPPGVHFVMGAPAGPSPDSQHATVAVTSLLQGSCASSQALATKIVQASSAMDAGDLAAASAGYRAALEMAGGGTGGSHEALLGLAGCASAAGDPEGAMARAKRAMVASPPHWPDAAWAHARFARQLGDSTAASGSVVRGLISTALREAILRGLLHKGYAAQPDALADSLPAFIQFDEAETSTGAETEQAPAAAAAAASAGTAEGEARSTRSGQRKDSRQPPTLAFCSSLREADVKTLLWVLEGGVFSENGEAEAAQTALRRALVEASRDAAEFISGVKSHKARGELSAGASAGQVGSSSGSGAVKRPRTDSAGSTNAAATSAQEASTDAPMPHAAESASESPAVGAASRWTRGVLSTAISPTRQLTVPKAAVSEALMCALSCAVLFQPVSRIAA